MKRKLLLVVTVVGILGTAVVLGKAGWFGSRSRPAPTRTPGSQSLSTSAAMQYRHAYPRHWRHLLLQR
jgi:hypothetical protein